MASFDVIAILKNESWNLKEWLDHYIWQGARRFYICDNGSTDNPCKILEPYVEQGIVEYKYETTKPYQIQWYKLICSFIQESEDPPDWILQADLDEFWYSSKGTLSQALSSYDSNIDIITTNWKVYGPAKESKSHPKSLRQECVYRSPTLGSYKYIYRTFSINPEQIEVHDIWPMSGKEQHTVVDTTLIHCNHYVGQSYNYWIDVKIPRGFVLSTDIPGEIFNPYNQEVFIKSIYESTHLDTELRDQIINLKNK